MSLFSLTKDFQASSTAEIPNHLSTKGTLGMTCVGLGALTSFSHGLDLLRLEDSLYFVDLKYNMAIDGWHFIVFV